MNDINAIVSLRMQMLSEVADNVPSELNGKILEYLQKHMADKTCMCAVGEIEGKIVAKAMLCIYEAMPDEINVNGQYARLFSVYTLPSLRGLGYMEKILTYLLNEAKKNGIEEIFASAEEKAIPLYKRIGFNILETELAIKL